jgi:outer membrane protein assembly factor BamB
MYKNFKIFLLVLLTGAASISFSPGTVKEAQIQNGSSITLSASSFNFNARRVGSLCGFTFDVTNTGSEPLIINSVTFNTPRFRFDNINANFPIIIRPGSSRTLRIWFNPNSPGTFNDAAVISSNADNLPNANITLSGTGSDNINDLGDIFWSGQIPDDPNSTYQDYQPKSIKRIDDVNGDGKNDVIVATENYWTICYNGNASVTADTLWKFTTDFGMYNTGSVDWEDAVDILPDINNDGADEVVIGCGGGNEMVYCLSGATGQVLWAYGNPNTYYDGDIYGLRCTKDYNGDGKKDVLISASGEANFGGRHAVICVNGLNGQEIFNVPQNYNFTYDPEATQTGGALGSGNNGGPYAVNGFSNTGVLAWSYAIPGTLSSLWSIKQIPDINNDNDSDLVFMYGFNGGVVAITGDAGAQLWTASLGNSNNGKIVRLDDKDKNGFIDISLSGPQAVNRIDSKTGNILWSTPLASSYIRGIDDIGDISGDTLDDIAVMTQVPGKLVVLDGATGGVYFEYVFGTSIAYRGDRVAAINSIDGNSTKEMVAGSRDGRIICFSGGPGILVGVKPVTQNIPSGYKLYQNYPNPFNPETNISFDLPRSSHVKLRIFDAIGRELSVLADENMNPGNHIVSWDASKYSSGVYFYEIQADGFRNIKKMILIK